MVAIDTTAAPRETRANVRIPIGLPARSLFNPTRTPTATAAAERSTMSIRPDSIAAVPGPRSSNDRAIVDYVHQTGTYPRGSLGVAVASSTWPTGKSLNETKGMSANRAAASIPIMVRRNLRSLGPAFPEVTSLPIINLSFHAHNAESCWPFPSAFRKPDGLTGSLRFLFLGYGVQVPTIRRSRLSTASSSCRRSPSSLYFGDAPRRCCPSILHGSVRSCAKPCREP